jgi:hypothetical protein
MPLITAHASEPSASRSTYSVKGPLAVGLMRCSFVHVGRDSEGLCGGDSARAWGSLGRLEDEPAGSSIFLTRAKGACRPSTLRIDGSVVQDGCARGFPAAARRAGCARVSWSWAV